MRISSRGSGWLIGVVALSTVAGTVGYATVASGARSTGASRPLTVTARPARTGALSVQGGTAAARSATATTAATTASVTLLSGERVTVATGADGQQNVSVPGSTGESSFTKFRQGGDTYVVPAEDVPYLGSTLDPLLFDVSYLVRAKLDDAHSAALPVTVTATAGAAAAIPALTGTVARGSTARTSVSRAQAPALRTLMFQRWNAAADGVTPDLPGVRRIVLTTVAGVSAPATPDAQPKGGPAYHTLTMKFINSNGKRGAALGFVQDVDSVKWPLQLVGLGCGLFVCPGAQGSAQGLVADGTYSLGMSILTPHPTADHPEAVSAALVLKPQVTVSGDTTVTFDARTANVYQASTPAAVPTAHTDQLGYTRIGRDNGTLNVFGFYSLVMGLLAVHGGAPTVDPVDQIAAAPTGPVTVGKLGFQALTDGTTQRNLDAPSNAARYFLIFPSSGSIPATMSHTIAPAQLTTVRNRVYDNANVNSRNNGCNFVGQPPGTPEPRQAFPSIYLDWGVFTEPGSYPTVLPGESTQYWYSSEPQVTRWQNNVNMRYSCYRLIGALLSIRPGQHIDSAWGQGPLVPSPAAESLLTELPGLDLKTDARTACPACRQDDNGIINLMPFGDSDPTHQPNQPGIVSAFTLKNPWSFYRNGRLAAVFTPDHDAPSIPNGTILPLLGSPAGYRLHWGVNDTTTPMQSSTDWRFGSAPTDPSQAQPATQPCMPDASRGCSYLPLLFVGYQLGVDYANEAVAGQPFQIGFSVRHQQYAPSPSGVQATVSISTDDGATWSTPRAAVATGPDAFSLSITNPALTTTHYVSVRIVARDGAGNAVTQTNIRAYGLHA